jgi:NADPH2:quinone reductase
MKAFAIKQFGGNEKIALSDFPKPEVGPKEVLIEVSSASVNPVDWKIREGYLKERLPHHFPIILGWDAAGTIRAVGPEVHHLKIGDEVFAYCRKPTVQWGTFAEYVAFDADNVALKPQNISFSQAAAVPLIALTAWQALHDVAKLKKGETILVHAGAGGVGSMAIQFAKLIGAHVITTASTANHDYVKQLGAETAIDYKGGFIDQVKKAAPGGVDVVFDCAGGKTLRDSYGLLKPRGRLISIVEAIDPEAAKKYDFEAGYVFVRPNGPELTEIGKLISEKKVSVPRIEEMPLAEASNALDMLRNGKARAKIVLKVK